MDFSLYRHILSLEQWQEEAQGLSSFHAQWLLHSGSLTQKLQQHCKQLQVEVIAQGWVESDMRKGEKYWLREVLLKGDDTAWIFAQTSLSETAVNHVAQHVLTLAETPIGLWLFQQKPVRQYLAWQQHPESGWYARRSILSLQQYPIEIKELFLPSFSFK